MQDSFFFVYWAKSECSPSVVVLSESGQLIQRASGNDGFTVLFTICQDSGRAVSQGTVFGQSVAGAAESIFIFAAVDAKIVLAFDRVLI